jgi:hypothetical protein
MSEWEAKRDTQGRFQRVVDDVVDLIGAWTVAHAGTF